MIVTRIGTVSSDLDVHQGRVLGVNIFKRRFHGGRLGMVDRLEILIDRIRRRLGVLIDNELNSGLRHFNRYGVNDHGNDPPGQTCQARIYVL